MLGSSANVAYPGGSINLLENNFAFMSPCLRLPKYAVINPDDWQIKHGDKSTIALANPTYFKNMSRTFS